MSYLYIHWGFLLEIGRDLVILLCSFRNFMQKGGEVASKIYNGSNVIYKVIFVIV